MIPASYKPRKKFMELAVAEAKRAGDRGDYPIGAVITLWSAKTPSSGFQRTVTLLHSDRRVSAA